MTRVLIIGGYGNFGGYIARTLARDPALTLVIAGRSLAKATAFAAGLHAGNPAEGVSLDITADVAAAIAAVRADIVIHTTGPFQSQDYRVARAAIACGAQYLDLADARAFVAGVGVLDRAAKAARVAVIAGASSVPCLTAAVIDRYLPDFAELRSVDYGISAAQQTNRGLATTAAILSYVGKGFDALKDGKPKRVHGWQNMRSRVYPELGRRLFGDCDIPDLTLFPERYPSLGTLRFGAGHEIAALHLGTWALSWLVRAGLVRGLAPYAAPLLRIAFLFDRFGSSRSGFHMILSGTGHDGHPRERRFFIVARSGHGPYIPCMPAILLTRRIARGEAIAPGARACLDLIDLPTYLAALDGLDISIHAD